MQAIKWHQPVKTKGKRNPYVRVTQRFDPAFLMGLQEYASQESERTGAKVSQATILFTLALRGDAQLRELYRKHQSTMQPPVGSQSSV